MRVVMYHYVRPATEQPPRGYYRLDLADFRAQLDVLEAEYDVLDRRTLLSVLRGETPPPDDGLVLTFDDGLVDHTEWVVPELRTRGLTGIFFATTGPLDGAMLPVHRVHALLGTYPAERVDGELRSIVERRGDHLDTAVRDTYDDGDDAASESFAARVKRLVNFELPVGHAGAVLDDLEARFDGAPPTAETYYLSADDLASLTDAGMLVGAHTVTHPVLSRLPVEAQRVEIRDCVARLDAVCGPQDVRLFAYPFGGPDTYTDATMRILREAGVDAAFTTVSGTVEPGALSDRPLELRRQDCTELPHGDSSHEM